MYPINNLIRHPHSLILQSLVFLYTKFAIAMLLISILLSSHPYYLHIHLSHSNYLFFNSQLSRSPKFHTVCTSIIAEQFNSQNQVVTYLPSNNSSNNDLDIQSPGKRSSMGDHFVTPLQIEVQPDVETNNNYTNNVPPKSTEQTDFKNQSVKNAKSKSPEPKDSKRRISYRNKQLLTASGHTQTSQSKQQRQIAPYRQPIPQSNLLLCKGTQLSMDFNKYYRKLMLWHSLQYFG